MIFRAAQRSAAFTLIEMMISAALMTIVLGSAYLCLSAGVSSKRLIDARADGVQSARTALNMIAADIRATVPMAGNVEFLGMRRATAGADADNLDFSTRNYNPKSAREPDYCEISYFLLRDPESDSFILTRRRDPTPDPEPLDGGVREEIARGVRGLRFEYYDGLDWFDEWGDPEGKTKGMMYPPANSYGLPEAVRITIVFDPEKRRPSSPREAEAADPDKAPMTFQTIARLDLAAFFNRQTVSKSNSGTDAAAAPEAAPQGAPQ